MSFADRVAIVTGGTGALGQVVTRRLLAAEAWVAVPCRAEPQRDALERSVPAGGRARLVALAEDPTDARAMARVTDTVLARWGRIDILVTAAGGFRGGALVATDRATWDAMLDRNLTSTFTAARGREGGRDRLDPVAGGGAGGSPSRPSPRRSCPSPAPAPGTSPGVSSPSDTGG